MSSLSLARAREGKGILTPPFCSPVSFFTTTPHAQATLVTNVMEHPPEYGHPRLGPITAAELIASRADLATRHRSFGR